MDTCYDVGDQCHYKSTCDQGSDHWCAESLASPQGFHLGFSWMSTKFDGLETKEFPGYCDAHNDQACTNELWKVNCPNFDFKTDLDAIYLVRGFKCYLFTEKQMKKHKHMCDP